MKKSCPWKEGHPLNRVHLSEQFYEKKVDSNKDGDNDGHENVT